MIAHCGSADGAGSRSLTMATGRTGTRTRCVASSQDGRQYLDHRILLLPDLRVALRRDEGGAFNRAFRQLLLRGVRHRSPCVVRQLRFLRLESRQAGSARFRKKVDGAALTVTLEAPVRRRHPAKGLARSIHSTRRSDRPDCTDWRADFAAGLHGCGQMASTYQAGDQHFSRTVQKG
jgi:hypothetical protein